MKTYWLLFIDCFLLFTDGYLLIVRTKWWCSGNFTNPLDRLRFYGFYIFLIQRIWFLNFRVYFLAFDIINQEFRSEGTGVLSESLCACLSRLVKIRVVEDPLHGGHVLTSVQPLLTFPLNAFQPLPGGLSVPLGERDFSSRTRDVARITDDRRSFRWDMIICNSSKQILCSRGILEPRVFYLDQYVTLLQRYIEPEVINE